MTEQDKVEMQQMIAAILPQQTTQQPPALSAWGKPQAQQQSEPESISIPVSITTQAGKVRLYLNFPGITTPEQIIALLDSLFAKGVPVDAWQDKKQWGGNSWKK